MTIITAIILGIVEGLTEFLPVSSTGHLIMAAQLMRLPDSEFLKTFEIVIQLGAIAAVAWQGRKYLRDIEAIKKVLVAFLPAALIGLILYKAIKSLLGEPIIVVWALAIGGLVMIAFEMWLARHVIPAQAGIQKKTVDATVDIASVTYRQAFIIGLCQTLAVIPGVSRSGASIVGGLAQGLPRSTVVEFSFLLAVPTMLAATGLDLLKTRALFGGQELLLLTIGLVVSYLVAAATVKFLLAYVRTKDFTPFGIYRIIAAFAFWLLIR